MYRVIAPEQMGHGRTGDAMDREFHYHDMAEDTVELMSQLKIESAVVVGVSDGGILGFDMAIHHPPRVTKLALIGANYRIDGYDEKGLEWLLNTKPDDWPKGLRERYERLSPDGASHWPVVFERLRRMWAVEPDYTREQMASIKAPTLVIVGDKDLVRSEHAVEMFRAIPGAQLCVLPHTVHGRMPMETILSFLTEPATSAH